MGQYHYMVNLDKREFLHPHKLGDGLKRGEQINSHGGTMAALTMLLACSNGRGGGDVEENPMVGRWAGDRIAVVGDYAEDADLALEFAAGSIHDLCEVGGYRDISDEIKPLVERECQVRITGDGWRKKDGTDHVAMRPDMVIEFGESS